MYHGGVRFMAICSIIIILDFSKILSNFEAWTIALALLIMEPLKARKFNYSVRKFVQFHFQKVSKTEIEGKESLILAFLLLLYS